MSKKTLYLLVSTATLLGLSWVMFNLIHPFGVEAPELCLFKRATGLPCPSCGSTHAVMRVTRLDWTGAWNDNPLGFLIAFALVLLPVWLIYDLVTNKPTFYHFYARFENYVQRRWVAIPLVLLVVANWIWSIHKHLS